MVFRRFSTRDRTKHARIRPLTTLSHEWREGDTVRQAAEIVTRS